MKESTYHALREANNAAFSAIQILVDSLRCNLSLTKEQTAEMHAKAVDVKFAIKKAGDAILDEMEKSSENV